VVSFRQRSTHCIVKYAINGKKDYEEGTRGNTSHSNESSSKQQEGKTHNTEKNVSRFNVMSIHVKCRETY
jgi:hypothetical protein